MITGPRRSLADRLRALFRVVLDETAQNPAFAKEVETALAPEALTHAPKPFPASLLPQAPQAAGPLTDSRLRIPAASFDPLAVHLEVAMMNGREQEARDFLRKLSRTELQEVVQAQRLPGARALQKAILEASDPSSMVDEVVASAGQKAKGRYSAAG